MATDKRTITPTLPLAPMDHYCVQLEWDALTDYEYAAFTHTHFFRSMIDDYFEAVDQALLSTYGAPQFNPWDHTHAVSPYHGRRPKVGTSES